MNAIESRQNPYVKRAKKFHQKKFREMEKLFILEGARALREVMKSDYPIETLYYSPGILDKGDMILVEFLCRKAKNTFFVSDEIMEYISPAKTSQKILALLPQKTWKISDVISEGSYYLAINQIQDPGNLGAIIRSARAFACKGIFLIGNSVEWYNPKVARASAGYILDFPFIYFPDAPTFLDIAKQNGLRAVAFSPDGKDSMEKLKPVENTVYIMGGETSGLGKLIEEESDAIIGIRMEKGIESLNLSISASIALYEIYKFTLSPLPPPKSLLSPAIDSASPSIGE